MDTTQEIAKVTGFENIPKLDEILRIQDSRPLTQYQIEKLEVNAKRNWDIFYKQNETRFFKDRHWTVREFPELLNIPEGDSPILLELGCGVGNFLYPILTQVPQLRIWACDFSPRAIDFVKSHAEYDETRIKALVADLTLENCFQGFDLNPNPEKANFVSLIFVMSAIAPEKHCVVVDNILKVTKPGSVIFFRDYGLYDMAQLRFKPGKKISDNFYFRRDGTRSYYFSLEVVKTLFTSGGHFEEVECEYINRRTINVKEEVDVGRIYVQGKFVRK